MPGITLEHAGAHDASTPQQKTGISFFSSFVTLGIFAGCPRRKPVEALPVEKDEIREDSYDEASTSAGSDMSPSSADEASSGPEDCDSSAEENSDTDSEDSTSSTTCAYSRHMLLQFRSHKPSVSPTVRYTARSIEAPKADKPEPKEKAVAVDSQRASWRAAPRESKSPTSPSEALTPSATSWAAKQQQRRLAAQASQEDLDDADVVRRVKSILNKLTIEKFESLYTQLTSCGLRKAMHVELLVGEVFEKATTQHRFIAMYADLCSRLDKHFNSCPVAEGACNFRRVLLDQCQSSFERSLVPPPELSGEETSEEDRLEAQNRYKQRMLGNIRLVGELLVRKMLSPRILLACVEELISQPQVPDRMESLAALLTTVGPKFDDPSWAHHALLDGAFMRVSGLVSCPGMVSARARFLLQDVLDLRSAGWVDKKVATKVEGPKKLDEVHQEAAQEAAQVCQKARDKDRMASRPSTSNRAPAPAQNTKNVSSRRPREEPKTSGSGRDQTSLLDAVKALAEMPLEPVEKPILRQKTATRAAKSTPQEAAAAKAKKADECSRSLAAILSASEMVPQTLATSTRTAPARKNPSTGPYDLALFHSELSAVMRGLAAHNATAAVDRIDGLQLPVAHQAAEFANIITRAAEEANSAKRRAAFAFAAGLAKQVFDRNACAQGFNTFCTDVYQDLREEVPGLRGIVVDELVPALQPALPQVRDNALRHL